MPFSCVFPWYESLSLALQPEYILPAFDMPATDDDAEAGFLRLVAECFGAFIETDSGVCVKLLTGRKLGGNGEEDIRRAKNVRETITTIRTVSFHKLATSNTDNKKRLRAQAWFVQACGVAQPRSVDEWKACLGRLRDQVSDLSRITARAVGELHDEVLRDELLRRLRVDIPRHVFLAIASEDSPTSRSTKLFQKRLLYSPVSL